MNDFLLQAVRRAPSSWTRIHPVAYALGALVGLMAMWQEYDLITREVAPALVVVGVVGLGLWWWLERRARGRLAIAQFEPIGEPALSGKDIQRLILGQLAEGLPRQSTSFVAIPVILGKADSHRARTIALRSRASYILYGDVTSGEDGLAILPRLIDLYPGRTIHADDSTHDVLPVRLPRDVALRKLNTQLGISDVDYPMAFGTDLEGLVLALDGLVLSDTNRDEALGLLQRAIDHTQGSMSSAADQLYVERAFVQLENDQPDQALDSLRSRLAGHPNPSAALLRTHSSVIVNTISLMERMAADGLGEISEAALGEFKQEAIDSLRQAMLDESDPLRDMSRYNLASVLLTSGVRQSEEEAQTILRDLAANSPIYRKSWYVHRAIGVGAWQLANAAAEASDEVAESDLTSQAAVSYSRAIRLRPRWQIIGGIKRFPVPPIMRANARDAHQRAGNKYRAFWQGLMLKLRSGWLLRRSIHAAEQEDWDEAAKYARLVIIGTRDHADQIATQILAAANEAKYGA